MKKHGLPLLMLLACGACDDAATTVTLGSPMAPTAGQLSASSEVTSIGTGLAPANIGALPDNVLAIFSTMQMVGGDATSGTATTSAGLTLTPDDLPTTCYTGSTTTGYTYTKCASGMTTYDGSVKISGGTVTIDLTATSSQSTLQLALKGSVTDSGTGLTGSLTYTASAGTTISETTKVSYAIGYAMSPYCITSGNVRTDDTTSGKERAAVFYYVACNMFMVENG